MSLSPPTYILTTLISAPNIHTDLLWGLTYLFIGLVVVYFGSVFFLRNKISRDGEKIKEKKKELSPIISEFLFYDESGNKKEKINYIDLKIQIRELIKNRFDRKVLTDILMDLRKDVSGQTRKEVFRIYQDLELHKDAYEKLKSWRWEVVSKGLFELTQMDVKDSFRLITRFINDKRPTIRKQAEIAVVMLKEEGITYFLDHTRFKISEWQQLKLLDVVRNKENFLPPPFRLWLTSKNNHVVLFSLRLIKYYNQNDSRASLIELVKHRNDHIKKEAMVCLRDFNIKESVQTLKMVFPKCGTDVKMYILDALAQLGSEADMDFLKCVEQKEPVFTVRNKAISAMNTICPEVVLPTQDIDPLETVINNEKLREESKEEQSIIIENPAEAPPIINKKNTTEPEGEETIAFDINNLEVFSEELNPDPEKKPEEDKNPEICPEELSFLPVVTEIVEEPSLPELKEIKEPHKKVDKEESSSILDYGFLPIVVAEGESRNSINEPVKELNVIYDEVLDVLSLPVHGEEVKGENQEIKTEASEISATNDPEPMFSDQIPITSLLNIEIDHEVIIPYDESEQIDWSMAFEKEIEEHTDILADLSLTTNDLTIDFPIADNFINEESFIPEPLFYEDAILEKMVQLENIEELGDCREIPYLKALLVSEKSEVIRVRIGDLIQKFSNNNSIPHFKVDPLHSSNSVFNELIEKSDLEAKLILIHEIAEVGDEKELPLLRSLAEDKEKLVSKQARIALKTLKKRILLDEEEKRSNPDRKENDPIISNVLDAKEDLFDLNFVPEKGMGQSHTSGTRTSMMTMGNTLFDHLCSMSSKFYNKING
ncbi:hypothetical protein [Maribacter sp. 2304DJ31-5]|uniref:hypothetical protein n=1 Tax=Maribacter sp. 2304DJ31-5 TaxID=3386273 RepID=UPI0039BCA2B7